MNLLTCWQHIVRLVPLSIVIGLTACQSPSITREASPQPDAASAAQPVKLGDATGALVYEGQQRTYHVYTPKRISPRSPTAACI